MQLKPLLLLGLFLATSMLMATDAQTTAADVIVIGAGISGIAAARKLIAGGVKTVIVLEGRDRKGGRLFTAPVGTGAVDLGGSWIHGASAGNPLVSLASSFGLTMKKTTEDNRLFTPNGMISDAAEAAAEALQEKFVDWVEVSRDAGKFTQATSLQDAYNTWLTTQSVSGAALLNLRQAVNSATEQEYAASLRVLSALWYDQDEEFSGGDAVINGGYTTLVEALAKNLVIRYNIKVTAVDYSAATVKVTTATGAVFTAPYVISTLPLGVLQSVNGPKFTPAFTGNKATAIAKLGMGLLNKVVLQFPTAFWIKAAPAEWINFVPTVVGEWSEFFSLFQSSGVPTLIAFSAGDFAWQQEGRTDAAILTDVTNRLKTMFPTTYQAPTATRITRWGQDPWAYGSYSYMKAGAAEAARTDLSKPLNNRLFFAGEATHQQYPATAHGALLSGEREANRVLQLRASAGKRRLLSQPADDTDKA